MDTHAATSQRTCFVTVGTTSFDELIKAINEEEVRQLLVEKHAITHLQIQYGRGLVLPCPSTTDLLIVEAFEFRPTLADEMKAASLVISHAGAGSVMEALRLEKPLIVVVNDALMDNHQTEIAEALARGSYVDYAPSPNDLGKVIASFRKDGLKKYPARDAKAFAKMLDAEMGFES